MGSLPASSIAARLGINRTTVFSSLKRLQEKNLVYAIPKKGGTFFSIFDAVQLEQNAKTKLKAEEQKYSQMIELVKNLEQENGSGGIVPKVIFFEGESGIISLFRKMLVQSHQHQAFLTLEKISPKILQFLQTEFIEEKNQKNVFSQVLIPKTKRTLHYQSLDSVSNRETRFVPSSSLFETEIIIAHNSLALIDFKEGGIGVFIESPSLCNTLRSVFQLLWEINFS